MGSGSRRYALALMSSHWAQIRRDARELSGGRCEMCRGPGEEVHHLTYERLGHETLDDVMVVCFDCHEQIHDGRINPGEVEYVAETRD